MHPKHISRYLGPLLLPVSVRAEGSADTFRGGLEPRLLRQFAGLRNYGVFGHGMAHTDTGVEGSSLPPDVPQGMATGSELLAGHARQAPERECSKNSGGAELGCVWHDSCSSYRQRD